MKIKRKYSQDLTIVLMLEKMAKEEPGKFSLYRRWITLNFVEHGHKSHPSIVERMKKLLAETPEVTTMEFLHPAKI